MKRDFVHEMRGRTRKPEILSNCIYISFLNCEKTVYWENSIKHDKLVDLKILSYFSNTSHVINNVSIWHVIDPKIQRWLSNFLNTLLIPTVCLGWVQCGCQKGCCCSLILRNSEIRLSVCHWNWWQWIFDREKLTWHHIHKKHT